MKMPEACDIGGDYEFHTDRPPTYNEPCRQPAAVRYRQLESHPWNYRCEKHAKWLDRSRVTVESLPK